MVEITDEEKVMLDRYLKYQETTRKRLEKKGELYNKSFKYKNPEYFKEYYKTHKKVSDDEREKIKLEKERMKLEEKERKKLEEKERKKLEKERKKEEKKEKKERGVLEIEIEYEIKELEKRLEELRRK